MINSVDVEKVMIAADEIAVSMNSDHLCAPHILASMLKFGYVQKAFSDNGVNVAKLVSDVQEELQKVVAEIHSHLERQDEKIDKILEVLGIENHRENI